MKSRESSNPENRDHFEVSRTPENQEADRLANISIEEKPETPETKEDVENLQEMKISSWVDELVDDPLKSAMLDTHNLTRDEIKEIGYRLALNEPFAFESAYGIHDFWLTDKDLHDIAIDSVEKNPVNAKFIFSVLHMSNEQIKNVLKTVHLDIRDDVLRALKIPGLDGIDSYEGVSLPERESRNMSIDNWGPEAESVRERIPQTAELSARLGQAICEAFPDRAPEEERRAKIEQELLEADFIRVQAIGHGETAPMSAMLEGRDLPAVYKLFKTEPGTDMSYSEPLRAGVKPGTGGMREWLAHQVGRILQPGRVPVTVLRQGPLGEGALQDWVVGEEIGKRKFVSEARRDPELKRELIKNACFDTAVSNSDRHPGNKQISERGILIDIDNGLTFPKQINQNDELRSCALWVVANEQVEDAILAPYERFMDAYQAMKRVELYDLNELEQTEARMGNRFKALIDGLKKGLNLGSPDEPPSDEDRRKAKMIQVLREQFDLALQDDAEELFKQMVDNIEKLVSERKLGNNGDGWNWWDLEKKKALAYYES